MIQIYFYKKNFDVQKAERFFKERRIPFQSVDMKKHAPGIKELAVFARAAGGADKLVDRENQDALSHPVCYTQNKDTILEYLAQCPQFLKTPLVRQGQLATVGINESVWSDWIRHP